MTEESLKQGVLIKQELDRITEVKHDIMVYLHEKIELDIAVRKTLEHCSVSPELPARHFTLYSDSPLCIAIEAALEGMREELQDHLDNLDNNMVPKGVMRQDYADFHPIARTSWYEKAFRWVKPKNEGELPCILCDNISKKGLGVSTCQSRILFLSQVLCGIGYVFFFLLMAHVLDYFAASVVCGVCFGLSAILWIVWAIMYIYIVDAVS